MCCLLSAVGSLFLNFLGPEFWSVNCIEDTGDGRLGNGEKADHISGLVENIGRITIGLRQNPGHVTSYQWLSSAH